MEVGPELDVGALAQVGDAGEEGAGVDGLGAGELLEYVGDDRTGLGEVGRAGRVADHAADPHGLQGTAQQPALERGEAVQVLGAAPPARLGAAAQGAEAGAGHVDQDAVEAARTPGRTGAVGGDHLVRPGVAVQGLGHQTGAVRLLLGGEEEGTAFGGQGAEQRRLPAGARAAVQPAPVRAFEGRVGQGQGDELAALVLDAGPVLPYGVHGSRLAALAQAYRVRGPAARHGGLLGEQLVAGGPAGAGDQGDLGALVVRGQQLLHAGPAAAERVPQRRDDPAGVRVHDGEVVLGVLVVGRRDPRQPPVEVVHGDLAQHRVDELGPSVAEHDPRQLHRGGHGGVARDARPQQLVGAQAEHVQHRRVHLPQRPVDALGDDRVVRPLPAQRAVHQLRRERRVPRVEVALLPGLAQQRRQHQVGVRVPLVHGPERLEGEDADGILLGPAVRLAGLAGTAGLLAHEKGAPDVG